MRGVLGGPIFHAGAAFGGGVLAGALLLDASPPSAHPAAAVEAVALLALSVLLAVGGRLPAVRAGPVLLLCACVCAGFAVGRYEARRAVGSCAATLAAGTPVAAEGRLLTAPAVFQGSAKPSGMPARAEIGDVRLFREGRTCRLPRLTVQLEGDARDAVPGDRVRVHGRWEAYAPTRHPRPRPVHRYGRIRGTVSVPSGGRDPGADGARGGAGGLAARWRAAAGRRLTARLPPDVAGVASALLLAERGGVHPELQRQFANAGLAHVLAVSGLHVGLVGGLAFGLLGMAVRDRRRWPWAAAVTGGYVLWIGAPPSAVRASLLLAGWAAARWRGSPVRTADLLGGAAAVALAAHPLVIREPGFQLSYAGFAGLSAGGALARRWLGPRREHAAGGGGRWWGRKGRTLLLAACGGAGAYLFTAPVAAAHFQRTAPVAVVSSLVGVPLTALALTALVGTLVLPDPLAWPFAGAATAGLRLLVKGTEAFAALPLGHGPVAPPGPEAWAAGLLLAAALAAGLAGRRRRVVALAGAAWIAWAAWPAVASWPHRGHTLVCVLDVGQGDAVVARTREGHWLAVDAGPAWGEADAGLRTVVPFLRAHGARGMDVFVLTHPHADHLGGAEALFDRYRVARAFGAAVPYPGTGYAAYLARVEAEGARWRALRTGDRLRLDELDLLVLGPAAPGPNEPALDPNETSVVLRMRTGAGFALVAAGDATFAQEFRILAAWPADSLRADVLKVAHHGSAGSTSPAWLEAVRPELAVISAGRRNPYGHPAAVTLSRIRAAGARVWRTDRDGTLCLEVAGDGTWRERGR